MQPIWILNDLFVVPAFRRQGVAKQLMQAAADYGRQTGAVRLELATQISNQSAQALYESQGYIQDTLFYHYSLSL
jgi:ribosomal protein S18 acetylase RimI-like enzyme